MVYIMLVIRAEVLYDGYSVRKNKYIVIDENKIVDVTDERPDADVAFSGVVTPAFIDGHSHIGMVRHSEPSAESEVNEQADIFVPDLDPLDSVYFDDKYFSEAVEFGVLYSCIMPGSGNLLSGKAVIIRNYARNRAEAPVRDIGYKMALGFNPRSTYNLWRGKRFHTRMGVYALLHRMFHRVIRKKKKIMWRIKMYEKKLKSELRKGRITIEEFERDMAELREVLEMELTPPDRAVLELLEGKKVAKVHVHKEDDAIFLVNIVQRYGIRAIAEHLCDVHRREPFSMLKDNGIPIIYGPLDSLAYKTELKHETYKNVKYLIESGAKFALMSDHPVVLVRNLYLQLRYFLMYGYDEAKAISIITKNAAEILGIDDILGTVEPEKWASMVVWDGDPLYLRSRPIAVIGEGKILYEE